MKFRISLLSKCADRDIESPDFEIVIPDSELRQRIEEIIELEGEFTATEAETLRDSLTDDIIESIEVNHFEDDEIVDHLLELHKQMSE